MSLPLVVAVVAPETETQPPLVIAHGFLGQGRNWGQHAKALATTRRVIVVDMRNHGASPWDARMDYPAMAEDLAQVIDDHADGRAVLLGHSMGGKAAMACALTAPEKVAALIVADIAPVAYAHDHRGYLRAMMPIDLAQVKRRADVDAALREAAPDFGMRAFLIQNLRLSAEGASWIPNLPVLHDAMEPILDWPASLSAAQYLGPAQFIAGAQSGYVHADAEAAIKRQFPRSAVVTIPEAGHWLHADQPAAFQAAVNGFIDRLF